MRLRGNRGLAVPEPGETLHFSNSATHLRGRATARPRTRETPPPPPQGYFLLLCAAMTDWKTNLVNDAAGIEALLRDTKTIAVLGIKPESHADQAGFYVPAHMAAAGYDVIPVPVYYPEVTEILGSPVFRKLADIGRPIDMVNVFRRPSDIPPHVDDILAANPKSVWFQLGIRNDEAAQVLAEAGIKVVQDRCLMVEEGRLRR
jgi:uncharacterized protein